MSESNENPNSKSSESAKVMKSSLLKTPGKVSEKFATPKVDRICHRHHKEDEAKSSSK